MEDNFAEFINNYRTAQFYKDLEETTKKLIMIENHNFRKSEEIYNSSLQIFNEGIIEPIMIRVQTYNQEELNKEFSKFSINFNLGYNLSGSYDKKTDTIQIYYSEKDSFNEIEAIIGHEFIHKIQHSKSENYFKQSEIMVKKINDNAKELNILLKDVVANQSKIQILQQQRKELTNQFYFLSSYEKMAYAYQYVKMNSNFKNPSEILKSIKLKDIADDNKFKKYIGMYWLIRDKI